MENSTSNKQKTIITYAGFWWRFIAFIVDGIVISAIQGIFVFPVLGLYGLTLSSMAENSMDDTALGIAMLGTLTSISLISGGVTWLYYAFFESSKYMATPGKMVFNIKVTDMEGRRISFLRATGRYFGKILSAMILYIGFIMAGFTQKKQALHDILAGCLVVKEQKVF